MAGNTLYLAGTITTMSLVRTALTVIGLYYLLQQLGYGIAAQIQSRINVTPKRIRVRFDWATPSFVYLDIVFQVQNDNGVGGTADGFEGQLFYGATRLGDISLTGPIVLPANAITDVAMTARVSLAELPVEITQMIQRGEFFGALRVKGVLYTSYVNIPIDQNVPIA